MARLQGSTYRDPTHQRAVLMTKRQRAVREEEAPISSPVTESEQIERAKQRIKELQLLIKHWRKQ
jgi:hypothetical protein